MRTDGVKKVYGSLNLRYPIRLDTMTPTVGFARQTGLLANIRNGKKKTVEPLTISKPIYPGLPDWWTNICRELAACHPATLGPRPGSKKMPRWVREWWTWVEGSGASQTEAEAAMRELALIEIPSLAALKAQVSGGRRRAYAAFGSGADGDVTNTAEDAMRGRLAALAAKARRGLVSACEIDAVRAATCDFAPDFQAYIKEQLKDLGL